MALNNDQAQFVAGVSRGTGIDPRVIIAQLQVEGSYNLGHNYLGLRPPSSSATKDYSGVPIRVFHDPKNGAFETFGSVNDAVTATVNRLHQQFAQPLIRTVGQSPGTQIKALGSIGWDAGNYGGGGSAVQSKFTSLFGAAALNDQPLPPSQALAVASTVGTGSAGTTILPNPFTGGAADLASGAVQAATTPTTSLFGLTPKLSVPDFLGKLVDPNFWIRALQILGGAGLVAMGLYLLIRQVGLAAPSVPGPVGTAARAAGGAE
jgi:hypothetical protein